MKPARGVPPVKQTARAALPKSKVPKKTLPDLVTTLPSLRLDPFLTKQALDKLVSGEAAREFNAGLRAKGDYDAYVFFKSVMQCENAQGKYRMEAAGYILNYDRAKKATAVVMTSGTPEDLAREIRAAGNAIDDCIEKP
jgi:hypothetical protein